MFREGMRLLKATSQELRFTQRETTECLLADYFHSNGLFQRLCEQQHGVRGAPAQHVRHTQNRSYSGEPERDVSFLTDAHSPFEQGECPGEIALAEARQAKPP